MKFLLSFLFFLVAATTLHARETVTIVYAFGAGDSIANYYRTLIAEANAIQSEYTFIFDVKPGAGNAIAANYVRNTPNTILGTSSAFFIRPVFYPNESYRIDDFLPLLPQCESPILVSSAKYSSWNQVPANAQLSIGVSGLGVTTHLIAIEVSKKYPNMIIVPFRSTSDALVALLSGTIDFQVGFVSQADSMNSNDVKKLHILGSTGTNKTHGYPLLHQQGFSNILSKLDMPTHMMVSSAVPPNKLEQWRQILYQASQSNTVQKSYKVDKCEPISLSKKVEVNNWYQDQKQSWTGLSITASQ